MDRSANARRFLELLLPAWQLLLQRWALEGAISRAASEALGLNGEPPLAELPNPRAGATGIRGLPACSPTAPAGQQRSAAGGNSCALGCALGLQP
jgi:hypothetical protein